MQLLELTLDSPEANLALDEALLEEADETGSEREVLRVWEPAAPMVVIGRSSRWRDEVHIERCQAHGIPILRRSSGGASIVAGPGCLMYAVILSHAQRPELARLDAAHRAVLQPLADALAQHLPGVVWQGTSDLAYAGKKFSGNSLRCKRQHLVYHGTLLYDFPLPLVSELLRTPPRQPDYRAGREHGDFIANLPLARATIRQALLAAFPTTGPLADWPRDRVAELVGTKYASPQWNYRL